MSANYPDSIVSLTNPLPGQFQNNPSHAQIETDQNEEIVAIETELGLDLKEDKATLKERLDVNIDSRGYSKNIDPITNITDTYTILSTDSTIVCNKETEFTVTLPVGVLGKKITIKNIGIGKVTVQGSTNDITIESETTQRIHTNECLIVRYYATNNWGIV